ncbi:hypothetical protein FF100_04070 [Methylobacterium terricola]|uniref:DUF5681 domain-containing protein n=1 Tax=Methylobacterium terricola TaxID=2583531 RepID=A0A5C4LQD8_9HYPH|nr:DUF5681 domain-containing protein [Methylobacterium terricola]TNC16430.1 hypothetical protein FF100_04070 [Methylobacterium terricola]
MAKPGTFPKGQSGNPAGKAKGTRNRTTIAMQELLEGEAEKITRKAVELALLGDTVAIRLCMERLVPVRKDRHVQFDLPDIETAGDIPRATSALLKAVASGEITPAEAADIGRAVDAHLKAIETHELTERLNRLDGADDR